MSQNIVKCRQCGTAGRVLPFAGKSHGILCRGCGNPLRVVKTKNGVKLAKPLTRKQLAENVAKYVASQSPVITKSAALAPSYDPMVREHIWALSHGARP